MYIQIWNTCNMTCEHCCVSAITRKGPKMDLNMVRRAMEVANRYGNYIVIGGGEPTLHPQFTQILLAVIGTHESEIPPLVVTNGANKEISLALLKMAEGGVISAELSLDEFHDPIDSEVEQAYRDSGRVRDTSDRIIGNGRGRDYLEMEEGEEDKDCCCPDWMVRPDGRIFQCGCDNAPQIGTLDEGITGPIVHGECYRSEYYQDALKEHMEGTAAD